MHVDDMYIGACGCGFTDVAIEFSMDAQSIRPGRERFDESQEHIHTLDVANTIGGIEDGRDEDFTTSGVTTQESSAKRTG